MDISEQGMTILWLRVLWATNRTQKHKLNKYLNQFIKQVHLAEEAIMEADKNATRN